MFHGYKTLAAKAFGNLNHLKTKFPLPPTYER